MSKLHSKQAAAYEPPQLQSLGTLRELTASGGPESGDGVLGKYKSGSSILGPPGP